MVNINWRKSRRSINLKQIQGAPLNAGRKGQPDPQGFTPLFSQGVPTTRDGLNGSPQNAIHGRQVSRSDYLAAPRGSPVLNGFDVAGGSFDGSSSRGLNPRSLIAFSISDVAGCSPSVTTVAFFASNETVADFIPGTACRAVVMDCAQPSQCIPSTANCRVILAAVALAGASFALPTGWLQPDNERLANPTAIATTARRTGFHLTDIQRSSEKIRALLIPWAGTCNETARAVIGNRQLKADFPSIRGTSIIAALQSSRQTL